MEIQLFATFFQVFFELHWVFPYHSLNSELANFETPCSSHEHQRNVQNTSKYFSIF
ncbi:unnamed protein product [Tenebrio molitor]|nr:unnamed protein product [Tenebrio molitor]